MLIFLLYSISFISIVYILMIFCFKFQLHQPRQVNWVDLYLPLSPPRLKWDFSSKSSHLPVMGKGGHGKGAPAPARWPRVQTPCDAPRFCFMFFQRKNRGRWVRDGLGCFVSLKVFMGEGTLCQVYSDFAMWVQVYFLCSLWANIIWGRLLNPVTVMKASTVFCVLAGPQMLWLNFLSCHGTNDWNYPLGL